MIPTLFWKAITKLKNDGFSSFLKDGTEYAGYHSHKTIINKTPISEDFSFRYYTNIRSKYHNVIYAASPHPYAPIWIDPHSITKRTNRIKSVWGLSQVVGGDWDHSSNTKPISTAWVNKGLRQRFEEGYDWENTVYYKYVKNKLNGEGVYWGFKDINSFREIRCQYVDQLYNEINTNGYKPNIKIEQDFPDADHRSDDKNHLHQLEPLIVLNRNGEAYLRDGFHRVTIARILDIDQIPVNVLARHKRWQNFREAICCADNPRDIIRDSETTYSHPDLQVILSSEC